MPVYLVPGLFSRASWHDFSWQASGCGTDRPYTALYWLGEAAEHLRAFSCDFLCDVHVKQLQVDECMPFSCSFMSTSRAIPAKGLPCRLPDPAGQAWWLIWYVVNACRRPGRPHPASRRDYQAISDTMSERTLCHGSGQVVRTLKRPGPRHWSMAFLLFPS
jgi:hypothetical protein